MLSDSVSVSVSSSPSGVGSTTFSLPPPVTAGNIILICKITFNFKRQDGTEYDFKGLNYDIKLEITESIDFTYINKLSDNIIGTDTERFE